MCSGAGGIGSITFKYHMRGTQVSLMGTLDVVTGSGATPVWSMSGDQGDLWHDASATISAGSFYFEYTRGTGGCGDVRAHCLKVGLAACVRGCRLALC